jgi:hypothetical protein
MIRTNIINSLIAKHGYKSYLEIGTENKANNFNHIDCEYKVCVDPDPNAYADHVMGSDTFFARNHKKFDIIFIDGLHEWEQVKRDIDNAIMFLNKGGTIVCHDMNPTSYSMQLVPRMAKEWTGDCWKAWMHFRQFHPDLRMAVVDTDYGVGIIQKGEQKCVDLGFELLVYSSFAVNKKEWMNLITEQEFVDRFLSE